MNHFKNIYIHHADIYHHMIAAEDIDGNLLSAIEHQISITGERVLDIGSGTGRIPLLLKDKVAQIIGFDLHRGMLIEQRKQMQISNANWNILQGDMRTLPFPTNWFGAVTAGWALGHFQAWYKEDWQSQVDRVVCEMMRVTIPGGGLVIIETLTTGSTTPAPPTRGLADYYDWLENKWGFRSQQIQTDFQFRDLEEAVELSAFFFGAELAQKVRQNNWVRLPEWTGVWSKSNL